MHAILFGRRRLGSALALAFRGEQRGAHSRPIFSSPWSHATTARGDSMVSGAVGHQTDATRGGLLHIHSHNQFHARRRGDTSWGFCPVLTQMLAMTPPPTPSAGLPIAAPAAAPSFTRTHYKSNMFPGQAMQKSPMTLLCLFPYQYPLL